MFIAYGYLGDFELSEKRHIKSTCRFSEALPPSSVNFSIDMSHLPELKTRAYFITCLPNTYVLETL